MGSRQGSGFVVACVLAFGVLAIGPATAAGATANPRLAAVKDFAFALGIDANAADTPARLAGYDLVVLDGERARPGTVAALKAQGCP